MARKKKDKKQAFEESHTLSFNPENIPLPPDLALSRFLPIDLALSDKQEPQKPETEINLSPKAPAKHKEWHHYDGHRQRLRQRFLNTGGQDMPDYEFLELLLFRSQSRKDTKPLAKALLAHFGSLAEVLSADIRRLQEVKGCGAAIATDLKIVGTAAARMLLSGLLKRDVFNSWDKVVAYCRSVMASEEREQFRVLFLDKKNGLIIDKIMQTGTVDYTPVYPREVIKHALDLAASSLVLVHNHPSGDPTPSRQDIAMTTKLQETAAGMNITIYDHLIIGRNGYASFRKLDLL